MTIKNLIAGYESYTTAAELAASPSVDAMGATPTTITFSSVPCVTASIGGVSIVVSVSIDNTFDHGC